MTDATPSEADELPREAAILDHAARLFYERGYGTVGMRTIAEVVGVRASSLYHYFASKTDLLYQICLGVARDFIDELLPILSGPEPYAERMADFLRRHIELRWQRRHWISTAQQELRALAPDQAAEVAGLLRAYQRSVQAFIEQGAASGAFQVADPRLAGIALLDMVNGVNSWYRPAGARSLEEIATAYSGLAVYNLLGARRAGPPDAESSRAS
ncbi:MAG: TetR/AcrR family transcriptional regulator [Chloroflexales bacterium]|nr:TetR/AcrR family transcriptional regulator [Chloroflexales bacterium]